MLPVHVFNTQSPILDTYAGVLHLKQLSAEVSHVLHLTAQVRQEFPLRYYPSSHSASSVHTPYLSSLVAIQEVQSLSEEWRQVKQVVWHASHEVVVLLKKY